MATVSLKNVGPVEQFSFQVPADGGVVVFKARNGRGKSHTLNALDRLSGGKGAVPLRDMARSGEVEGFGAKLTVGKSTRKTGEVEVETLEGRLNLADLVDPGITDPERADAARIKALIQLAAVQPDPSLFYEILGGKEAFEAVCDTKAKDDDILALAKRVKKEIEEEARQAERISEAEASKRDALRKSAEGIDLNASCDQAKLQADMETAIREQSRLNQQRDEAIRARDASKNMRKRFEEAKSEYQGLSVADAEASYQKASTEEHAAAKALEEAAIRHEAAKLAFFDATKAKQQAEQHAALIASLEGSINCALPAAPSQAEITAADQAVTAAREALARAGVVAKAKADHEQAEKHAATAQRQCEYAKHLRCAATKIDGVLSAQVAKLHTPLYVDEGRLVINTKRGKKTLYAELSMGERWKIVIDLAADIVGEGGVIVIPQDAWEGIDPINRKAIADHARARRVVIFTAECSESEELVAETL